MSDKDDPKAQGAKSKTLRTFGRALSFFGTGAKAFLAQPMKAAKRGKARQTNSRPQIAHASLASPSTVKAESTNALHPFETVRHDFAASFYNTQQILTGHLQESAEFLRTLVLPNSSSAGFFRASCFPAKIARLGQGSLSKGENTQDLICSGSRSLLRIKLYDFAIYLDSKDVHQCSAKKGLVKKDGSELDEKSKEAISKQIRDSSDIEMSLLVRASRNLPILLLSKEYERILKRRLRVVGGKQNDPALHKMMDTFKEDVLPAEIRQGGSVKKGTVLIFNRDHAGNIQAKANTHELISVHSPKLAQAVFDIYLGDQVVCNKARSDGAESFLKLADGNSYTAPQSGLVCSETVCKIGKI